MAVFENDLNFITSLNYSANIAKMLNNLTFLYNPAWKYGQGGEPNMPISFFFVKDCKEVGETQLNTKTVMFYNSQNSSNSVTKQGALLDVIADNSINMPKEYQLDVLIPFQTSQYFEQYQMNPSVAHGVSSFIAHVDEITARQSTTSALAKGFTTLLSTTQELLKMLFDSLALDPTSMEDLTNFILNQNDINKVSLQFMRDSRRIVKMKWWNGWKFKYVMIKSLDIEKKGTDSNFYEGRMVLTEVPIMTILRENQFTEESTYTTIGSKLCAFLDKWFNDRQETK